MARPSFARSTRTSRSHDLLLFALDHFPTLELGERAPLLDPDDVAHVVIILFVMGVIFLGTPYGLLHDRVGEAALHSHNHGLVLLVAHHDALKRALRHLCLLRLGFRARAAPRLAGLRFRGLHRELRAADALLRRNGLDASDVAPNLAHPRG